MDYGLLTIVTDTDTDTHILPHTHPPSHPPTPVEQLRKVHLISTVTNTDTDTHIHTCGAASRGSFDSHNLHTKDGEEEAEDGDVAEMLVGVVEEEEEEEEMVFVGVKEVGRCFSMRIQVSHESGSTFFFLTRDFKFYGT